MDRLSREMRSANMSRIRSTDMLPEITVRKIAYRLGFRYRKNYNKLPGKPDLAFPRMKKVIFVNGCFWHQHESANCSDAKIPKSNEEYWQAKFERTKSRDKATYKALRALGWDILVIWECQLKKQTKIAAKIANFLAGE